MDTMRQDIVYAFRRLWKAPAFTIVALVTLSLGIGANSAIFTVVNGVLLKPLPYDRPDELVGVFHLTRDGHKSVMSPPNFLDVRAQNHTLADVAACDTFGMTLTGVGEPVRLDGAEVSAGLFGVLRVQPILGRTFRPEENEPGRTGVVLLGHQLWQQRFGASAAAVGRVLTLDGKPHVIIGVLPPGFAYPARVQLWTPIEYDQVFRVTNRGAWYIEVIGRLKPGVTADRAAADVAAIARRLQPQFPESNTDVGFTVAPLGEHIIGDTRTALLVLLGAVGLVLLIACANVANLMLARAASRQSEIAIRAALGAGRRRLIRQLLTESAMLAIAGGAIGLLIASWGSDLLVWLRPNGIPRLDEVRIDGAVLAFTGVAALLTGLLFGSIPAVQATQPALMATLKDGGRGALTGRHGSRVRGALVISEMALAVTLLIGAGLLINSFIRLQHVDPGFRPGEALTFRLALSESAYADEARRAQFFARLLDRLRTLPGVRSAGAVVGLPLTGREIDLSFDVEGRPPAEPGRKPSMEMRVATPDYFATLGIPLKRGRMFTDADAAESPQVAVLSESAARRFFPHEDPIGKRIVLGWHRDKKPNAGGEVVGIVGDVKDLGLDEEAPPEIYLPHQQLGVGSMDVVLRSDVPPLSLARAVEQSVHQLDPNVPVSSLRTVQQLVAESISQPRFYVVLLGSFAGLALVLAVVGIFGVMSYAVTQQTREIGIRIALGADRSAVVRMVLQHAMVLAGTGLAIGLVAALALARTLASMLFDLSPNDPLTFAAVLTALTLVALVASYIPARRATRVDPVVALRAE